MSNGTTDMGDLHVRRTRDRETGTKKQPHPRQRVRLLSSVPVGAVARPVGSVVGLVQIARSDRAHGDACENPQKRVTLVIIGAGCPR